MKKPLVDTRTSAVLGAAQELFSRYGFRRTSVADIAQAAGVAKGSVYLSFKSKEEVFRAVAERMADQILADARAAAKKVGALSARLTEALAAKFVFVYAVIDRSPHAAEIIDSKNALCADLFVKTDLKFQRIIARILTEGAEQGALNLGRAGLSVAEAAALFVRACHGLGEPDPGQPPPDLPLFRERLSRCVQVLVRGLA